jgi:hypothetical protein
MSMLSPETDVREIHFRMSLESQDAKLKISPYSGCFELMTNYLGEHAKDILGDPATYDVAVQPQPPLTTHNEASSLFSLPRSHPQRSIPGPRRSIGRGRSVPCVYQKDRTLRDLRGDLGPSASAAMGP